MPQELHIFDRALLRERRRRVALREPATFLIDQVAEDLAERLSAVMRHFDVAVDLGTPTDAARRTLSAHSSIATMLAMGSIAEHLISHPGLKIAADEEALPFKDASLDLLVSALALQFVNDLPGALIQIRRALKPDGLFLAAMVGGETLTELRQAFAAAESDIEGGASPRVAPFE